MIWVCKKKPCAWQGQIEDLYAICPECKHRFPPQKAKDGLAVRCPECTRIFYAEDTIQLGKRAGFLGCPACGGKVKSNTALRANDPYLPVGQTKPALDHVSKS